MTSPSRMLFRLGACAVLTACATSPAATPERSDPSPPAATAQASPPSRTGMNAVGTYDYTAIAPDGSQLKGSFTISGSPGAYSGTIEREGQGGTPLTSIAVEGQAMTLTANIPEGTVTLTLAFTGNDFTGQWSLQDAGGAITGRKR